MAQVNTLVNTLKRALKARGLTYRDVAKGLNMSEASIKRMFASQNFSLYRLEAVCELIDYQLTDLIRDMENSQHQISQMLEHQEQELVSNILQLLVAVCVRNRLTFEEITSQYNITNTECIKHMAHLDRLGLIDFLPGNRYRLKIAEDFRWIHGGPVERFIEHHVQGEFLKSHFTGKDEFRMYVSGLLSTDSQKALLRKMDALVTEFNEYARQDAALVIKDKKNVAMFLALRPWELNAFKKFKRT